MTASSRRRSLSLSDQQAHAKSSGRFWRLVGDAGCCPEAVINARKSCNIGAAREQKQCVTLVASAVAEFECFAEIGISPSGAGLVPARTDAPIGCSAAKRATRQAANIRFAQKRMKGSNAVKDFLKCGLVVAGKKQQWARHDNGRPIPATCRTPHRGARSKHHAPIVREA